MPTLDIFQIDAFADAVFRGNPAAVCPLTEWLPEEVMQAIAAENNLSETAFFVPANDGYDLRWFTPALEVELCGHATLATAYLILTRLTPGDDSVEFETRSGRLTVTRDGDRFFLDFPAYRGEEVACPPYLSAGLGVVPRAVVAGPNYMAVLETEADVAGLRPDMAALEKLHPRGVIVTAPGEMCDFVSRHFGPSFGVPEDPVTGSAHCMLIPYWAKRLEKLSLDARQISARGGRLWCEDRGDRAGIGGTAVMYLEGRITV
jgi:predicted PhzF superfamily epimerase YddE/YHI9